MVTILSLTGTTVFCRASAEPAAFLLPLAPNDAGAEGQALTWLAGSPVGLTFSRQGAAPQIDTLQLDGAAARAGLRSGDVLVLVDHTPVPRAAKVAEQIQAAWAAQKSAVDVVVSRQGHDLYVVLPLHR